MFLKKVLAVSAGIVLFAPMGAKATTTIDLTTNTSPAVNDGNGAIYERTDSQSTGTGVIRSFVREQAQGGGNNEQGYNTDNRPVQFDELTDPNFTRSVLITQVPIVSIGGVDYRQFLLDINQNNGNGNLLSLNRIQVYLTDNPSITGFDPNASASNGFGSNANLVYSLDGGPNGDTTVALNYDLNSGSGSGDMFLYVRNDLFTARPTDRTTTSSFTPSSAILRDPTPPTMATRSGPPWEKVRRSSLQSPNPHQSGWPFLG